MTVEVVEYVFPVSDSMVEGYSIDERGDSKKELDHDPRFRGVYVKNPVVEG